MVDSSLINSLTLSRLGNRDRVGAVINIIFGIIFIALAYNYDSQEHHRFRCKSDDDKNKENIKEDCFLQYDDAYNSPALSLIVVFSFLAPAIVCMVYCSCVVNSRVCDVKKKLRSDEANHLQLRKIKTTRVFNCCVAQLSVRFALRIMFMIVELIYYYDQGFKSKFSCHYQDHSNLECVNSVAPKKEQLSKCVFAVHAVFALFLYLEFVFLIYKSKENKEYRYDSVFCQKYLHIMSEEESLGSNN